MGDTVEVCGCGGFRVGEGVHCRIESTLTCRNLQRMGFHPRLERVERENQDNLKAKPNCSNLNRTIVPMIL